MVQGQDVTSRIAKLDGLLADWIPSRDTWNPADEALYKPVDLFRVPLEEAQEMQLKAIKYTFTRHYNNNGFYRTYCTTRGVSPEDIKTVDDLFEIPLIPDLTFKQYPEGRDFARWLASVFTGELPKIVIKGSNPTFDDVINAFNAKGVKVTYSTGTSGRFTFIPRDQKTFLASGYAIAKTFVNMWEGYDPNTDGYLLFPNPKKTNAFVGKVCAVYFDMMSNVQVAIDRELTTAVIQAAMEAGQGSKRGAASPVQNQDEQKMIDQIVHWLERHDQTGQRISIIGAPYVLHDVMEKLQGDGKSFDFGERGVVVSGGGWKIRENARMPIRDFRKQVRDVLGIPENCCFDVYAMVEGNGWMMHCPEGHYLHTPYTYYKPFVLDKTLAPVEYGEWGRLAFLDALANSYPGFIITGDEVRMHERCPVCDRPGPVLEPEVKRAKGAEIRGCAEVIGRVLAEEGKKSLR
jgi:phenylacetate-coenzyme A ligase PaaK-like adenylate-forming protein